MIKFINKQFLPQNKVKLCVVAKGQNKIKISLENLGIKVIECDGTEKLDYPIRNHPDINLFHLGGENIICDRNNTDLINKIAEENFNIIKSQSEVSSPYPNDVSLNIMILNNKLWCGKNADDYIIKYAAESKIQPILLNQGYVKCTTCIVNEISVITSDKGTAEMFKANGLDVLLINHGEIDLPGYDYGFIGGCCGLIDKNTLAFTGDISRHTDFEKIKAFLSERGVKYISLTNERLIDIGSIIPLKEFV